MMVIIMFWVFFVFCFVVGLCVLPFFFFLLCRVRTRKEVAVDPLEVVFLVVFFLRTLPVRQKICFDFILSKEYPCTL